MEWSNEGIYYLKNFVGECYSLSYQLWNSKKKIKSWKSIFTAKVTYQEMSMKLCLLEFLWHPCQTSPWGQETAEGTQGHTGAWLRLPWPGVTTLSQAGSSPLSWEWSQKRPKVCKFLYSPKESTVLNLCFPSHLSPTASSHLFTLHRSSLFFVYWEDIDLPPSTSMF